jgi:hypothetical protein
MKCKKNWKKRKKCKDLSYMTHNLAIFQTAWSSTFTLKGVRAACDEIVNISCKNIEKCRKNVEKSRKIWKTCRNSPCSGHPGQLLSQRMWCGCCLWWICQYKLKKIEKMRKEFVSISWKNAEKMRKKSKKVNDMQKLTMFWPSWSTPFTLKVVLVLLVVNVSV